MAVSDTKYAPGAIADENHGDIAITYEQPGVGWGVAVCTAAPDPSFQAAWPCATDASAWSNVPIAALTGSPVASAVAMSNGDVVAMFMESTRLITAVCPLAWGCANAANWRINVVANANDFAAFAANFSVGRSTRFFTSDVNGLWFVDQSSAQAARFNFLSAGFTTLAR
jgi:hypothetical protein